MELFYSALSDAGNVRSSNEDYLFAGNLGQDEYLFIVADGMGGHNAGEIASRKAVSVFVSELEKSREEETKNGIGEELKRILLEVNEALMIEGSKSPRRKGMGTTLSALYIKGESGYIAHVGDSRIYRYLNDGEDKGNKPGQLMQLTEDHSFVGKLLKNGFITEEEARSHPKRNVIYQSIGLRKEINIQVMESIPIKKGQKYLLCSDGLSGVVPAGEIVESLKLKGASTSAVAKQLVKKAKRNGGPDNISVIVVSTEMGKCDSTDLADTIKIVDSYLAPGKRKKKIAFLVLLGLLILLLAALIYLVIVTMDADGQPLAWGENRFDSVIEILGNRGKG